MLFRSRPSSIAANNVENDIDAGYLGDNEGDSGNENIDHETVDIGGHRDDHSGQTQGNMTTTTDAVIRSSANDSTAVIEAHTPDTQDQIVNEERLDDNDVSEEDNGYDGDDERSSTEDF